MDYKLTEQTGEKKSALKGAWESLGPLLKDEKKNLFIALSAVFISSGANLLSPFIIAHVIDTAIRTHDYAQVLRESAILAVVYLAGLIAGYNQTIRMGTVGRGVLFKLRNALFIRLSELPVAFFNQNRTGDLISRINNDTDKLNQFFGQALMQFIGSFFVILGAGILLLSLNWRLGIAALIPALVVFIITQFISDWVKRKSRAGLQSLGAMSGEVEESLANFKVIVAFNRVDYFRTKFDGANQENYRASVVSGIASNIFTPLYTLASNAAQLMVLGYGLVLISTGHLTIGLLVGYLLYVNNFYGPLRQLASIWSNLQLALAALDRIQEVLVLTSNLTTLEVGEKTENSTLLSFDDVSFAYSDTAAPVLHDVSFTLEKGKTYALVGPTGGGKTTTASLMARLFDPTYGSIMLDGKDIRAYSPEERTKKIGFILQEPFLFSGTVRDNIVYGNEELSAKTDEEILALLTEKNLQTLLERFSEGLGTKVTQGGSSISLGQKQLIAFMRAVLRTPELLILDEATANIDTVTEQLLEDLLEKLPESTTKVIIAHRLNTIQNADSIFFVNGGTVTEAGSMDHAVEMLLSGARTS
jgi:ATP-binding cassette subfamily B protein